MIVGLNDLQFAIVLGKELFDVFCSLIVHYVQFWLEPPSVLTLQSVACMS
jgi:hypothetical protein